MASLRGAVGFITFLAAFLVRRAGDDLSALGLVVAAAGIGGFVGSVAAPALRFALRESVLLLVCLAAVAAVGIWAAGPYDTTTLTVVAFVMGLASGAARLAFDSLLQADAPRHVRGRAFARYEMIFQLCWVAGAGAATVVPLRTAGGMRILAVIALTGFALAVHGLLGRNIRRRGVAPEAA
jgi:predicted MFS family arabinose efflux permease